MKDIIKTLVLITIGCFIFSIAVNSVVIPNELGEGGITGVNMLLLYSFGFNPAISNLLINTVILLIGWTLLERKTLYYTFFAVAMMSFFIQVNHLGVFMPENTVLAPLLSGLLIGGGVGLVIAAGGTTAGTDIIALIINKFLGIPVSSALLMIDAVIVTSLSMVIGLEKGVLSLISTFVTSQVINFIIEGSNPKKAVTIVSDRYEEIGQEIMQKINRGITVFNGYGFYSKTEKDVLYVVINRIQLVKLQHIIYEIDPNAFVTVSGIQQVIGEGFTFFRDDQPTNFEEEVL